VVEPVHPLQRRQLHGLPVLLGKTKSCLGLVQAIESDTQSALGHSARNWRLTLSSGHDLALSQIVVLISLPRRTLCRPSRRIGRSTVQRDHHTFPQELTPDLTRAVDLEAPRLAGYTRSVPRHAVLAGSAARGRLGNVYGRSPSSPAQCGNDASQGSAISHRNPEGVGTPQRCHFRKRQNCRQQLQAGLPTLVALLTSIVCKPVC